MPGIDPTACMAYRPAAGDRHRTVFLDAGHGGPDPGAAGAAVSEKDAALAVALALSSLLREHGFRVVLARTADTAVARLTAADIDQGGLRGSALHRDLVARVDCANAARADALLSIHFNGFYDASAGGTQTFYSADRPFAARSRQLAEAIQSSVVAGLGLDDRGVTADTDLDAGAITEAGGVYGHLVELGPAQAGWVDRPSAMPGALVEPLFLTAPAEGRLAATADGRARIAQALYTGLVRFLG